jgi:APA family basic amino acid/polyamine antiporter
MKKHTIGPILLSGLIIGPILGSGIIILPPLAYELAGDWALPAWLVMVAISFLCAWIFGKLSLLFPGDAGITAAIEAAFGSGVKKLTSLYLIGAVFFGPVAVVLTATQYLPLAAGVSSTWIALPLLCTTAFLLLKEITAIGRISLCMSSLAACVLLIGSIETLLVHKNIPLPRTEFSPDMFGYTLLLLFWSVVGWEVIGNYSGDIRNPQKNLSKAIIGSFAIIALVSLTVAAALQAVAPDLPEQEKATVTALIVGVFGRISPYVMAALTLSLCISTYLLFVGGVARLVSSLAGEGYLPNFLVTRTKKGAPLAAVVLLTGIHIGVLVLVGLHLINLEQLVAVADGFFLCNALIGVMAAMKLLKGGVIKTAATFLALLLTTLLLRSSLPVLAAIAMAAFPFLFHPREIRAYHRKVREILR